MNVILYEIYIEKYLNDSKQIVDGLVGVVRPDDGLGEE